MATLIQTLQHTLYTKDPQLSFETKRILLKEVLQAIVLDFLYNHPQYRKLNFYGGTCLHVVYALNRLSEDLDLDNGSGVDISQLESDLLNYFQKRIGYAAITIKHQQGENGILRFTLKFPLLVELSLSTTLGEALHLKLELSPQQQVAVIKHTPVFFNGHSFVPAHFSLETMMAGKMIACLERDFRAEKSGASIKGRDFYDLLWFMQKQVKPLEEKLVKDGKKSYTIKSAMHALQEKVVSIRPADLRRDLLPMFEPAHYVEAWVEGFQENFAEFARSY